MYNEADDMGNTGIDPKIQALIQQISKMGRGGDTLLAHLTPGEMEVPKEVQTPKVLATLKQAYESKGVSPQQFTAGSPQSSMNPQTGLPEYNFMSAFLPAALGIAGSFAMPWLAPEFAAASPALAGAIGGGAGTGLGSSPVVSIDSNPLNAIYQNYASTDSQILAIIVVRIGNSNTSCRASMEWLEIK